MTPDDLSELLQAGEGQRLEFKEEAIKPSDLAETLVAFANAQGGIVIIGVNDAGEPVGMRQPSQAQDMVLTAASNELCDPPVKLSGVTIQQLAEDVRVLVVTVPRSRR